MLYVTPDEARELYAELMKTVERTIGQERRFAERRDPAPPPARRIQFGFVLFGYPRVSSAPPLQGSDDEQQQAPRQSDTDGDSSNADSGPEDWFPDSVPTGWHESFGIMSGAGWPATPVRAPRGPYPRPEAQPKFEIYLDRNQLKIHRIITRSQYAPNGTRRHHASGNRQGPGRAAPR